MKKIKSNLFISVPALKSAWSLPILIAVGFIFYSCSETNNPVADSSLPGETLTLASTTVGVNEDPVVINNFEIKFNGSTYDGESTTFSYTVTRNSASGYNYLFFETPTCANFVSSSPSGTQTVFEDTQGIKWTSSIGEGQSQDISVTYSGKQPTGMVDAIIQDTGNSDIEPKPIPGPCKGVYTISGFIYVDENGDTEKDSGEGGIGNVTVNISKDGTDLANEKTSSNGSYSFIVYAGNSEADFTIEVDSTSNATLFENFSPTTEPPELSVTINDEDINGENLGFQAKTGKIIEDFEKETTKLRTEKPDFWADEFKFADKGPPRILFSKSQLLSFLQKIDDDYLELYNFEFGNGEDNRISKAQDILTIRGNSTELEQLRAELLAAMLNVASGNGAFDENDEQWSEFNDLIIKTGIAALKSLENGTSSALMMKSTTEVISTDTITSSISSGDLITSFNGSGGGVGSQ